MRELQAGRELDAQIATGVMGWVLSEDRAFQQRILTAPDGTQAYSTQGGAWASTLPAFSTEIAAAWEVVEHFRAQEHYLWISYEARDYMGVSRGMHWRAAFAAPEAFQGKGATAPLAICRAALQWAALMGPGQPEGAKE